ncbi:MAG: sodium:calcium antiporter, partial [bacterium]|nr:sodium:calcium antiporter [bacterium]
SDRAKLEVAAIEQAEVEAVASPKVMHPLRMTALPIALVIGIGMGAHLAVDNSIILARELGVSEAVIGVTFLAIGTSLPELATTIACIRKSDSQMLVGNIIGSNIFNILAVIGATALVTPITVPPHMLVVDFPVLACVTVAGLLFLRTNWQLSRREGYACLFGYTAYIAVVGTSIL